MGQRIGGGTCHGPCATGDHDGTCDGLHDGTGGAIQFMTGCDMLGLTRRDGPYKHPWVTRRHPPRSHSRTTQDESTTSPTWAKELEEGRATGDVWGTTTGRDGLHDGTGGGGDNTVLTRRTHPCSRHQHGPKNWRRDVPRVMCVGLRRTNDGAATEPATGFTTGRGGERIQFTTGCDMLGLIRRDGLL